MKDNLTTVALNGNAVGVFSATAIISNNGVNCYETLEQMKKSNLYYFYYTYLKSLNEGKSRSVAFNTAQKEYAKEVVADSANGIRSGEGNYQFNLINVLSYHNFGVLEPDFTVTKSGKAVTPGQAPQEVIDKVNGNNNNNGGNANIIGDNYILRNELKSGSFDVHKVELKDLGNGKTRITYEITAKAGLTCSIFNPPDGDLFMINKGTTTGARQTITCDVQTAHIEKINEITAKFYSTDDDKAYIFIKMQ